MKAVFENIFNDKKITSLIGARNILALKNEMGIESASDNLQELKQILRLEALFINSLINAFRDGAEPVPKINHAAYSILKSYNLDDPNFKNVFDDYFGIPGVSTANLYYFNLLSIGLRTDDLIKLRLDLQSYDESQTTEKSEWFERVLNNILSAIILLVRKENGFKDIRNSVEIIAKLQQEQVNFEEKYLKQFSEQEEEISMAESLLGLYHLSKTLIETATYLIEGYNYKKNLESEVRIHSEISLRLFSNNSRMQELIKVFRENLYIIKSNSIWHSTNDVQIEKLKKFCSIRAKSDKSLLDLLPSQRNAIGQKLLDIASNVTVVEMPTSSGKTLLAEFNIIVVKALNQNAKVIYVVPSRALVNQVYNDLQLDFEGLDFKIEKTSSAIEIDPSEDELLHEEIDILVSTPEKLDLLVRRNHESVRNVSLFIIDEAHTIQNGSRGAKLELLLSILKREKQNSKFMLLSPFLDNSAETLANWIGGNKFKNTIKVNWRPAEKLLIGIKQKQNFKKFEYTSLPSAYSSTSEEINLGIVDSIDDVIGTDTEKYIAHTAKKFGREKKSILYLCNGPGWVDKRATFLAGTLPLKSDSENISLVKKYIDDEIGRNTILSTVLSKGIALHHAGLSDETKLLVEYLIREKEIEHVFATSTLAEGVNFPVSAVYFDSYRKGDTALTTSDFWNISGRAGRTMVDNYGKLIFPFSSKENANTARELINKSSGEIASVLLKFVVDADKILETFDTAVSSPIKELAFKYPDSIAPLIQYIIHLLNSSGEESYLEIEDLFKDSLGYFQISDSNQKEKFIQVCSKIFTHLQNKYKKGTLVFADKTGFSVPSVLEIMKQENKTNPSIASDESWLPSNLFNNQNNFLAEKIKVIAKLKETQLGTDSSTRPFNEHAVAAVLIGWVKGEQLYQISNYHPTFSTASDESDRINNFIRYINSARFKASWGLGALEGIVRASGEELKENSHVPSLVYYGVDSKEALILRMTGVPRRIAKSLVPILDGEKKTLSQLRNRIKGLTLSDWDGLTPSTSSLTGAEWKRIAEILVK